MAHLSDSRINVLISEAPRIDLLIDFMVLDLGITRQEVGEDLSELDDLPTPKKTDLYSEVWMSYS